MPKKNNTIEKRECIYINNVPKALCHERQGAKSPFYSVSFMLADKWASFMLPTKMVLRSTYKDGTINENTFNLVMGAPDAKRSVSIAKGDEGFESIEMSNESIFDTIMASREAFRVANA